MPAFDGVYAGKTVMVTGHTGFKGGWLSLWLKELGAHVVGYALEPPTEPSFFEAVGLTADIVSVHGDVRDEKKLLSVVQEWRPDAVFHLAAQSLVRLSYREPQRTYATNVMGTVNVLESVRRTDSVRAAVIVTSDKCYENKEWVYGYREVDSLGGRDPYSLSKSCAELVVSAYNDSFFAAGEEDERRVVLASARAGNVIGGGDWGEDRLVPDCVRALSKGDHVVIRHPSAVRPWQHVLEPLSGYLWLASQMLTTGNRFAGAWNFGPAEAVGVTVEELVGLAIRFWGEGDLICEEMQSVHEANLLRLDCSKANQALKWRPVYTVRDAMRETMTWYRRFYGGNDTSQDALRSFSIEQIRSYMARSEEENLAWAQTEKG